MWPSEKRSEIMNNEEEERVLCHDVGKFSNEVAVPAVLPAVWCRLAV